MYRHKKKRTIWDRGIPEKMPPTPRESLMANIGSKKLLTISETASFLNISKYLVNKLIERGVLEIVPIGGNNKYISHKTVKGLLMPVRSLNKRLMLLEELKQEVSRKIENKQKQLDNEDNRN